MALGTSESYANELTKDDRNTQIVFVHGNGQGSDYWMKGTNPLAKDVINKYSSENVFFADYLTDAEKRSPLFNFHEPKLYERLKKTLDQTTSNDLVIIAHSFGVTLTLATLEYYDLWHRVSTVISFAGAIRGIQACKIYGPYNGQIPSCFGQSKRNPFVFGFYPGTGKINDWTASYYYSFRNMPRKHSHIKFINISLGKDDAILCRMHDVYPTCEKAAEFNPWNNVTTYQVYDQGYNHFSVPHRFPRKIIMHHIQPSDS